MERSAENEAIAWWCDAHNLTTTGDCPRCDDESIAALERDAATQTQEPCFWCRRGMHDSCSSELAPCRCCADVGRFDV